MFLIHQNISFIMLIPIILVLIFIIATFSISRRENLGEFKNSLANISNIDNLK